MVAFTAVLVFLILDIMSVVSAVQGTARVVNYAGLVRGTTQRIVKLADAQLPQGELVAKVDSYIDGLRFGSKELDLVRLDDDAFQAKMAELDGYYDQLVLELSRVEEKGYENTAIIEMSESFFTICDEATHLAEEYSQGRAALLNKLENFAVADIVCLALLALYGAVHAVRLSRFNRRLQSKVYLDEATGLPNKNKCEELLADPTPLAKVDATALCVFDMNNLRTINNNLGHEKGDEYIRSFAVQLAKLASEDCFVGRDGGDEFIAVVRHCDHKLVSELLNVLRAYCDEYSRENPAMPISYAAGYAISSDFESPTMQELFRYADKNMYVDKNRAKMEEASLKRKLDHGILEEVTDRGYRFTDCIYCDAFLEQYRVLRASSNIFLADSGNYNGAVEQIVSEFTLKPATAGPRQTLDLDFLRGKLQTRDDKVELLYERDGHHGRLTVLRLDRCAGDLHHFILGFEPFYGANQTDTMQLVRYYDQMRQSIVEDDNFIDALLDSAIAVYSVDLSHGILERAISLSLENRYPLDVETPCYYGAYCKDRLKFVTPETAENFRMVDSARKLLKRFEAGARQITVEYQERGKNGDFLWLQKNIYMTPGTYFDGSTGEEEPVVKAIIIFKETSAFHEMEHKEKYRLEKALKKVDEESRAKTEFMNRMSHDFRTPINGIIGMLDIIRASGDDPEKVHDCLDKIQVSSDHLRDLVNDVLDMSKLQADDTVFERTPFNIKDVLHDANGLVEAQLKEAGLVHNAHRENLVHCDVVGSPLHVRQILLNLFSNAIKYNKPGGSIDTYVRELSCDGSAVEYEFVIADTGIGMSEEYVTQQLFKPFTQEQFGARTQYMGTGLGMSIVKTLVEKMGGDIVVKSKKGEGTTISYTLTFELAKPGAAKVLNGEDSSHELSLAGKRILLVEDNDINMEIAQFYLESAGAKVDCAWNGKEALEVFRASAPRSYSLVLMDLMMPVMDGLQASRAIRESEHPDAKTIPILAMTANAFDEDKEKTKAAGMNAHLVKPLDAQKLLAALAQFL